MGSIFCIGFALNQIKISTYLWAYNIFIYLSISNCSYSFTYEKYIYIYESKSNVLQYFGNVKHYLEVVDTFAELAWYSPSISQLIGLHGVNHRLVIYGFIPVRICLIVYVISSRAKFLQRSPYCTVINYAFTFGRLWWCNGTQVRLANLYEWVQVSLGAPFIWPCATSKQKA